MQFKKVTLSLVLGMLVLSSLGCTKRVPAMSSPSANYNDSGKTQELSNDQTNVASSNSSGGALEKQKTAQPLLQSPLSLREESKTKDNFFKDYGMNSFINALTDNKSTFGIDVDTASYTWMRKSIENNIMVTPESVRTEEFINFFDYNYTKPEVNKFLINTELVNSRLGDKTSKILRVGIQGKEISNANRKDALLTFVIDVSGSMNQENRIALVKQSLELLVEELRPTDKVGIVVFGTTTKVVLEHTSSKKAIFEAINKIEIQGSTNTEAGLMLGYQQAEKYFDSKVNNRIILCSDGVANVGETGPDKMLAKIKQASESGISLSTIGFGMGNYNDTLMEQLADKGDGNYAYVDSIKEAQRIFEQNLTSTLQTIAKDTKIQVEFDPKVVKEYRLLGYENRDIADKDFRNDKVDAGEVGSNQSVTALYELKLNDNSTGKLANIAVRYKDVDKSETVLEINKAVEINELKTDFNQATPDFKLAVAVAEYADLLKSGYWSKTQLTNFDSLIALTSQVNDSMNKTEKVSELLSLITKAKNLARIKPLQ